MIKIFGSRQIDFCVAIVPHKTEGFRYYPFKGKYTRDIPTKVFAQSHWDFMTHFQETPENNDFLVAFFNSPDIELLWPEKGE